MARKVFISSDMSIDETLSEIAEQNQLAALMWPWILTFFDDWGRAKASPREIKNSVFPANDLITAEVIGQAISLYGLSLVQLYEVDGKPYMCIDPDKWFKYQTHIRREKRQNDGSKHPAPNDADSAQVRADARDSAESRANLTNCIPSPSPSPSLSKDNTTKEPDTIEKAYAKVFNTVQMGNSILTFIEKYKSKGYTDRFIIEVLLEAGESSVTKPTMRYIESIAADWESKRIYTRVEARKQREEEKRLKIIGGKKTDKQQEYNEYKRQLQEQNEGRNEDAIINF